MAYFRISKKEADRRLSAIIGKKLKDIDSAGVLEGKVKVNLNKGIAGAVLEQSVFGYNADSSQKPDLLVDGVPTELKTTGVRKNKRGEYTAKEPVSVTAVSIGKIEAENDFLKSTFWDKAEHILFVIYLYDSPTKVSTAEYSRFPILGYTFNEFGKAERIAIMHDWLLIRDYLRTVGDKANAEELYSKLSSSLRGELLVLDTSPKYPNNPRFRFKRAFVDTIVKRVLKKEHEEESLFSTYHELYSICHEIGIKFSGKSMKQIAEELGVEVPKTKAAAEKLIIGMFGGRKGKINSIDVFTRYSVIAKTVIVTNTWKRTEDMKLLSLDFDDLSDNDVAFEDTEFYASFYERLYLFPIFQEPCKQSPLENTVFLGFKKMLFPEPFINDVARPLFMSIRDLIISNELKDVPCYLKDGTLKINKKTGTVASAPNFPKAKNGILFVRGSGTDSTKKNTVVAGVKMYRQNVWIKGEYIVSKLKGLPFL